MAYEVHYTIPFKTLTGIDCHFDILENDYAGDVVTLTGAGRSPVVHSWDAADILDPIQGSKCVVQYMYERGGVSIADFITTDETKFRGDLYVNDELQFTGFMVIDDFSEPFLMPPTPVTLTFTDGISLLDNVLLSDLFYPFDITDVAYPSLLGVIYYSLYATGVLLPLRSYYNLFPNIDPGYIDRDTDPTTTGWELQSTDMRTFIVDDEGTMDNCKNILTKILKANKCIVRQEKGCWMLIRIPEYTRFSGNIPGGEAVFPTRTEAPELTGITIGNNGDLKPIERSQLQQFKRPAKTITNTYNYTTPVQLFNPHATRLGAFIGTSTSGENTLTDYELMDWENQGTEDAFIRVVTNTDTGFEVDRYFVMPFVASNPQPPLSGTPAGMKAFDIRVNEGDRFNLSFRFRADSDTNDTAYFRIGIRLFDFDGTTPLRDLIFLNNTSDPADAKLSWGFPQGSETNLYSRLSIIVPNRTDLTEWQATDIISVFDYNNHGMPRFPFDGILRIGIFGFNNTSGSMADKDAYIKDFSFEYKLFIADSIQITGQENKATNDANVKNAISDSIFLGSVHKYAVAGALQAYTGPNVPVLVDTWVKESGETEYYRHDEVNTIDEMMLSSSWRTLLEGDFYGLATPSNYASIDGLDGMFIPYKMELDYRQNRCRASFMEISKPDDPTFDEIAYDFRYLYKTE